MTKFCIYDGQIRTIENALTNGGKQEIKKALEALKEVREYYAIAGLSKEDIAGKLFEDLISAKLADARELAERITDLDIETMAEDMGNSYIENGYWIDIAALGDDIKARIEKELNDERDADRSD